MLSKYPNILKVIYLSTVLFLYQGIANTLMGILSQITHQNNRDWAGPVTTMLLYFFSGIGALYNKYLYSFKYRYIMSLGSLGYTFYVGSSIVFILIGQSQSVGILIGVFLLTVFSGLIVSLLYNGQYNYINLCASADKTTIYFGINMGIVQASNIFGNILSTFTIEKLGQLEYCIMMTILIFCVSLGFLALKDVNPSSTDMTESQITEHLSQNIDSLSITNFTNMSSTQPSLYRLLPSFYFSGIVVSSVYTFISVITYKTFPEMGQLQLNSLTFTIMIFEGVGQLLGALLFIFAADKLNKISLLLGLVVLSTLSILLLYIGSITSNLFLMGFGCTLMGICDCSIYSLDLAVVSQQNYGSQGYSAFSFTQCISVVISLIIIITCPIEAFVLYAIIFQIITSYCLYTFK